MTLPLLLVATAPLLIASFAFNFNIFNNIYFLTGGGPYAGRPDRRRLDGHPHQLHVQARVPGGEGAQYGLAAAVSIFIFFIVAGISAISFWRTKALEERSMTTLEHSRGAIAGTRVAESARRAGARSSPTTGGATSSASLAIAFALFPIVYVVSAAFNPVPSLTSAQLIPDARHARQLPADPQRAPG